MQLSLSFQTHLPPELPANTQMLAKASAIYSGDLLVNNKIRGIVFYAGLEWVCTGVLYRDGIERVDLQELLHPYQWLRDTHTNPSERTGGQSFYEGRQITYHGHSYVIGDRRLKLLSQEGFAA